MLKKKLSFIILSILLILSLMIPIVRAEDVSTTAVSNSTDNTATQTSNEEQVMPISEDSQNNQTAIQSTLKSEDVFLFRK